MDKIQRNKNFLRDLYTNRSERKIAISFTPPALSATDLNDYTLGFGRTPKEALPELMKQYKNAMEISEAVESDTVPMVRLSTGTQFFAQAFGCEVHTFVDNNPCAKPFVFTADDAMKIKAPKVENCPNLMRYFELAELAERELGKDVPLGPPDFQSGFDIANQIWDKSELMCALYTDPEAVKHLTRECMTLLKDFFKKRYERFPQATPGHCPNVWIPPGLGIWVSNDECGAISTEMFEEFCLPELIELSETFGGLGMHCCADAEHQFKSFLKIPNFYAFNRVWKNHGLAPLNEIFDVPGPVFTQAWMDVPHIRSVLNDSRPGSRWHFVFINCSTEDAIRLSEETQDLRCE